MASGELFGAPKALLECFGAFRDLGNVWVFLQRSAFFINHLSIHKHGPVCFWLRPPNVLGSSWGLREASWTLSAVGKVVGNS